MSFFELKVTGSFAAAHKLQMVAKKCENLHGHNWKVEACVKGNSLSDAGVLVDFGILKKYLRAILEELDHKYLNELAPFIDNNSSSERICLYIADELQKMIEEPGVTVSRVTVWESDDACATYYAGL